MSDNHIEEQTTSRPARVKLKLIASAFILLVLALGFGALLTISSLEKLYLGSIVSEYQVVGKDLQRNLEQALLFGKNINKFVGMNRMLEETRDNLTSKVGLSQAPQAIGADAAVGGAINVSVALPDGRILYSADEKLVDSMLPQKLQAGSQKSRKSASPYSKFKNEYYVTLPVHGRDQEPVAMVVMTFDQAQIEPFLNAILKNNITMISIILAGSTLLLVLLLHFVAPSVSAEGKFPRKKISWLIFIVVGAAQICFSTIQTNAFKDHYLTIAKEKAGTLTALLRDDIEYLLSKGIRIDKLVKMDVLMGEIIKASPEFADITVYDSRERPLYVATKEGVVDFQKATEEQKKQAETALTKADPSYSLRLDIQKEMQLQGYVSTYISKQVVFQEIRDMALDAFTVLFISILFLIEMLILMLPFMKKQLAQNDRRSAVHFGIMRPAAFLFLFGIDIGISFIPLHMENLYEPILGLSKDMVMGIPISARVLTTGIFIFVGGTWGDRRGWHEPFLVGLGLSALGFVYAWLAPDAIHFILSQAIFGIGYGFSLIAAQLFVVTYTTDSNRARGLAQLWAGVYAGSICGGAAGAMLAERIGYSKVFLIGAVILLGVIPYTFVFMREAVRRPAAAGADQPEQSLRFGQVWRFLTNRNISSLILFSSFPTAIALVGFLNYFSPVYLNRIGASQSNIGRILMIYGVCLIYIAPFVSKYVDASRGRKGFIVISGILGSMAFISFYFFQGIVATSLTVLLLGLSSSFGFASQSAYALKLNVTQELGKGKAMGIYSSANRLGQVLGPVTFGWLLIVAGSGNGVIYFGLVYLFITLLFFLFAQNDSKMAIADE